MTPSPPLVLAVDGGQTSSKALIGTIDGDILGMGTGSACDHLHGPGGYERNRDAIHTSARAALQAAGRSASDIKHVGLGLTSAPRESEALALFGDMVRELCDPATIWVDADFVSNLAGAAAGGPGVVVIAGGGSIGYGVTADGREAVAGGLGYLMGDEGSGWYIGLRAIQEAARGADRRGVATGLLPMVLNHYGIGSIREIIRIIYDRTFTRDQVSTLAPQVIALANAGDTVAYEIVTTGANRLGDLALGAIRQLNSPGDHISVYPTGGIFAAGPLVTTGFRNAVLAGWPSATVTPPRFPPVVGAYLKALDQAGIFVSTSILARLDTSLTAQQSDA